LKKRTEIPTASLKGKLMEAREQRSISQSNGGSGADVSIGGHIYKDQIGKADILQADWNEPEAGGFQNFDHERIARGLGWFSIGLGMAEIIAPRFLARFFGTKDHGVLFRVTGLREIASGIGILTQRRPAGWLWARVGGDIIDLAVLGRAFRAESTKPVNIAVTTAAITGVTALDLRCAQELSAGRAAPNRPVNVKETILINRSPDELYRYWRDFQNLPRFMKNLESVEVGTDNNCSRWTARGPAGQQIQWDAEIVKDKPGECIAWRSLEGADVHNSGSVRFETAPSGRGTLISVEMQYSPPAGAFGATVAKLSGRAPEQEVEEDLRLFKQMMETGEIITTVGQPAGRSSSTSWKYDQTVRRAAAVST
jgi:uncharacterized membrane protein